MHPAELWVVGAAGGPRRRVIGGDQGDAIQPNWSPHGRRIAFAKRGGPGRTIDIWTVTPDGGEAIALMRDAPIDWNPMWAPDGNHLYYSRVEPEGDLYVSRADGTGQRLLTGDAALDPIPH
jgi:Tol biopolymer transport system component